MLTQLKLNTRLKTLRNQLLALTERKKGFEERQTQLVAALEEAKTDEDIAVVDVEITTLEEEIRTAAIDGSITDLNSQIATIEAELADIGKPDITSQLPQEGQSEERGRNMAMANRTQVRELLKNGQYYERDEVKSFYEKVRNIRSITGEGLTVPQIVVDRIMDIVGDYSSLYPRVDKINASGTTRILIDTDTTAATWIEGTTIPDGDVGTITNVDFDGYKIGKVTFVDNAMLKDSIINLDAYITKKLASAIAKGIDLAILKGKGSAKKQPEGILESILSTHKVTAVRGKIIDIVKNISLIDDGEDSAGEIVAVMKRQTYYNDFLQYSINVDAAGNVVGKLPNLKQPDLLGLDVVFNNNMEANKVLFGDLDKYTVVERDAITIGKSEHVKFSEDQTAYRGLARFDGKAVKKEAFVLVELVDAETVTAVATAATPEGTAQPEINPGE